MLTGRKRLAVVLQSASRFLPKFQTTKYYNLSYIFFSDLNTAANHFLFLSINSTHPATIARFPLLFINSIVNTAANHCSFSSPFHQFSTAVNHCPLRNRRFAASLPSRQGLSWAALCCRDHQQRIWAFVYDGQVWSSPWQVHGLLPDLRRWCSSLRCECCRCNHQDQAHHSICWLLPNWIQVLTTFTFSGEIDMIRG